MLLLRWHYQFLWLIYWRSVRYVNFSLQVLLETMSTLLCWIVLRYIYVTCNCLKQCSPLWTWCFLYSIKLWLPIKICIYIFVCFCVGISFVFKLLFTYKKKKYLSWFLVGATYLVILGFLFHDKGIAISLSQWYDAAEHNSEEGVSCVWGMGKRRTKG